MCVLTKPTEFLLSKYSWHLIEFLIISFLSSTLIFKSSRIVWFGNCLIFGNNLKLNKPSLENKYAESIALKRVFPLLGYDANQIIMLE